MKLPLWRLISAILVLLAMASVLIALAPVYFEDYKLRQYVRSLVQSPQRAAMPDDALRTAIMARAKQLDLPLAPGDIQISRPDAKLRVQLNYAVQLDFPVYQVEVHFHPGATSPQPMNIDTPCYAVIFSSRRTSGDHDYESTAARMVELSKGMPGFLGIESARGLDGFGITVSYWRDEASIAEWRRHTEHVLAQERGKREWYVHYDIRIAKVERAYSGPSGR